MLLFNVVLASFEDGNDDGTGDAGAGDGGAGDAVSAGAAAGGDNEKKFTQADVNKFMQERVGKEKKRHEAALKDQVSALETNYKDLLENKNLDTEEKEKLETQLDNLRKQHRTKEQQLDVEKKALQTEWEDKFQTAVSEKSIWEDRFTESTINQALQSAAIKHEAFNPAHIITQLRGQTKLVDKLDASGKPTGQLEPMIEMTVANADSGATEQLQMTPDEAVEYMKKNPSDACFFKNNIREGIGADNATGGALTGDGTVDHTKLTDDQWFAMREKNPAALGMDYDRSK